MQNLTVTGMSEQSGGTFDNVKISGYGRIIGDLDARTLSINGAGTIKGTVRAGQLSVGGTGTLESALHAERVEVSGNLTVGGKSVVGEINSKGKCTFKGYLKATRVDTSGWLGVGNDLDAGDFIAAGSFKIEGLLHAGQIEVKVSGVCYAKEMQAESVLVEMSKIRMPGFVDKLFTTIVKSDNMKVNTLKAEKIIGRTVTLESTEAKLVRGGTVKIGPECVIDAVEYSDSIDVHPSAVVRQQTRI